MQNLVIVESPTKARTLQRFLGDQYQIEASMGHIRDLPKGELGVDINNNFEPQYIIPRDKRKRVNELIKFANDSTTLYLATDPDREGEAIAWHLSQLLVGPDLIGVGSSELVENKKKNSSVNSELRTPNSLLIQRVVFHEITEKAIKEAFDHPRKLDTQLIDAQQARRVLDRLVGYKLSPLLWQKVKKGSSAGRVQSVALRLIVEREREVIAFKSDEYWSIEAELSAAGLSSVIAIRQPRLNRGQLAEKQSSTENQKIAVSSFDKLRTPRNDSTIFTATLIEQNNKKIEIKNKEQSERYVKSLEKASYNVSKVTQKEVRRYPYPPFTTSTLQQSASNRLGMSVKKTMMIAQALYERGLITYMRTDSVNLSAEAIGSVRDYIANFIGKSYLPQTPRIFKSKSKNAQEAHEAIRPTDVRIKNQELRIKGNFNKDHVRLYDLIWKRFIACQMSEAVTDQTTIDVIARSEATKQSSTSDNEIATLPPVARNDNYLLRTTGSVIKFEGWLKFYGKEEENQEDKKQILPKLTENQILKLLQLLPNQHFTESSPRYNEASLIKKLEELGIGRPSTYAPIISTIQERFYVERIERKFIPTQLGFTVCDFLIQYFPDIFDYQFTAQMENELDEIAGGKREWKPTIALFFKPFEKKLQETLKVAVKVKMEVELAHKKCPVCNKELIVRIGKFGKFLACSGFPECKHTESIEEKVDAKCLLDGGEIMLRRTRKGKTFYGCKNWPVCKFASWTKPKTGNSGQATGNSKNENA